MTANAMDQVMALNIQEQANMRHFVLHALGSMTNEDSGGIILQRKDGFSNLVKSIHKE
jgi:hypothetical protein